MDSDTKFSHLCNQVHGLVHPFNRLSLSETAESCLKIQHILHAKTNINNINQICTIIRFSVRWWHNKSWYSLWLINILSLQM